jgi:uncharacterized membrane protein YfcA
MQRMTPHAVLGRVAAASEAVIGTPQTLSIILGAVLVTLVDYRLLFVAMAVVMAVSATYSVARPAVGAPQATGRRRARATRPARRAVP